jgi:hypothetical protein
LVLSLRQRQSALQSSEHVFDNPHVQAAYLGGWG